MLIHLKPSKFCLLLIFLTHCGAMMAISLTACVIVIKIFLMLLVGGSFIFSLRQQGWLQPEQRISELQITNMNEWYLKNTRGKTIIGELLPSSLVTRYLIILNFKVKGRFRRLTVMIFCDAIPATIYRKLQVQLWISNRVYKKV